MEEPDIVEIPVKTVEVKAEQITLKPPEQPVDHTQIAKNIETIFRSRKNRRQEFTLTGPQPLKQQAGDAVGPVEVPPTVEVLPARTTVPFRPAKTFD